MAPLVAALWIFLAKRQREATVPQNSPAVLLSNATAFGLLMYALSFLVDEQQKIPFWTLIAVYALQSIGELCLSPIGLSMVTKLAPPRLVGLGMGGWFYRRVSAIIYRASSLDMSAAIRACPSLPPFMATPSASTLYSAPAYSCSLWHRSFRNGCMG